MEDAAEMLTGRARGVCDEPLPLEEAMIGKRLAPSFTVLHVATHAFFDLRCRSGTASRGLGDLLLDVRPADALTEFTVLAALAPHDQASVNLRLARAHLALDDVDKATEYLLYALEIAPHFREAQDMLLETLL